MSEVLGRPLVKGETVHHRNGIRWDNRRENLELWTLNKGPRMGQRVKDQVEWARTFIDQYTSDEASLRT